MTRYFSLTRHGIPLLAVAMISFAGWSIAAKHTSREVTSPPIAAPTNPYEENVAGTGIVEPASEVIALAIERGGVVTRIDVMAGDRVKSGQPLFAIDDRDYRAAVAQDEAAVAAGEASIATIQQNLIQQGNKIDQARATLDSAEAEQLRASLAHRQPGQHVPPPPDQPSSRRHLPSPRFAPETARPGKAGPGKTGPRNAGPAQPGPGKAGG